METDRRGLITGVLIGIVLVLAASPPVSDRLGYTPPLGIGGLFSEGHEAGGTAVQLLPGAPALGISGEPASPDDPWREWLADERTCPGGDDRTASPDAQVHVMVCLVNFARIRQGVQPLALSGVLNVASAAKAMDIVRCRDFSHAACGKDPNQVAIDIGYSGSFGENIYAADDPVAAPKDALDAWLNSPHHRENLFHPEWRTTGVGVLRGADLGDIQDGTVWVNEFGV
jgi:hypothetical protein